MNTTSNLSAASSVSTGQVPFFEDVSSESLAQILAYLEVRRFAPGTVLVQQGDRRGELFVLFEGLAEVLISKAGSRPVPVGIIEAGSTTGEMSLLTGQPACATVVAVNEVVAVAIDSRDFSRLAARYPVLYRNLAAILAERLARSNRDLNRRASGQLISLVTEQSTGRLGYGLAASAAWHLRQPALFVSLVERAEELPAATRAPQRLLRVGMGVAVGAEGLLRPPLEAQWLVTRPLGRYSPEALVETLEELCLTYGAVVVEVPPSMAGMLPSATQLEVTDRQAEGVMLSLPLSAARTPKERERVVPTPSAETLADGLLSPAEPTAEPVGLLARRLLGLSFGLALGGGLTCIPAFLSAAKVMEQLQLPLDVLSGTGGGAVVAALLANFSAEEAQQRFSLLAPALAAAEAEGTARVRCALEAAFGGMRIEATPRPLAITASDLRTGCEVVMREGLLCDALLAALAGPGSVEPQQMGEWLLADGNVQGAAPAWVLPEMGAEVIAALRFAPADKRAVLIEAASSNTAGEELGTSLERRFQEVMLARIGRDRPEAAHLCIDLFPAVAGELAGGEEAAVAQAVRDKVPALQELLPWIAEAAATRPQEDAVTIPVDRRSLTVVASGTRRAEAGFAAGCAA